METGALKSVFSCYAAIGEDIFIGRGLNRGKTWDLPGLLRVIRRITRGSGFDIESIYRAWLEVSGIEDDDQEDQKFLQ